MDPFGDLFSFIKKNVLSDKLKEDPTISLININNSIKKNDVNEDKGIQNNETKRQSISKRRSKKTDSEYACDKCVMCHKKGLEISH